jgi:hypothetical protein
VADSFVQKITMSEAKLLSNIAKTNQYQVTFSGLSGKTELMRHFATSYNPPIDLKGKFSSLKLGILCSDASLPTSSFATAEVKDNFMGIPQEFAHTRLFTDIDFTFYVDDDYETIRFFEGWMDFISGGNLRGEPAVQSETGSSVYRRFNYPKTYKADSMYITKFERNYGRELNYQFINAFPKGMTAIPVSYGGADLLKVTVSFNYDRYIVKYKGAETSTAPRTKTEKKINSNSNSGEITQLQVLQRRGTATPVQQQRLQELLNNRQ